MFVQGGHTGVAVYDHFWFILLLRYPVGSLYTYSVCVFVCVLV
jgi:hypothetical protein